MYVEISAAVASAKTALEIVKAAHSISNYNELVAAVSEVNAKLMDATAIALSSQEKQASLSSEIAELKEKLRDIENWEGQMKRYRLHEFPTKALAYALKAGMHQDEPLHYICTCSENRRKKSVLQPKGHFLHCAVCKTDIPIQDAPPSSVQLYK